MITVSIVLRFDYSPWLVFRNTNCIAQEIRYFLPFSKVEQITRERKNKVIKIIKLHTPRNRTKLMSKASLRINQRARERLNRRSYFSSRIIQHLIKIAILIRNIIQFLQCDFLFFNVYYIRDKKNLKYIWLVFIRIQKFKREILIAIFLRVYQNIVISQNRRFLTSFWRKMQ